MTESRNQLAGDFIGGVVQAGKVGAVHFHAPARAALAGLPADEGFTGREAELTALAAVLAPAEAATDVALVCTVAGLAGIGKTALVVRAARRAEEAGWFVGGVLFIDLHGYDRARRIDATSGLAVLLRALGVAGEHIPPGHAEREILYRSELAARAAEGRRVLIIADNAAALDQVRPLRPGSTAHRMLVSSRHTLPIAGARRVEVDVLPQAEAIAVLEQALTAAHPTDARVRNDPDAAALLADLCGYLPLALRITAELLADQPGQSLGELVDVLSTGRDRLGELAYGDSVAVRMAFDASYRHLPTEQARLFRLLALNPGPRVSLGAAAALAGAHEDTTRRELNGLRRAHLIHHAAEVAGYRMHDLLRLYAQERCYQDEPATDRDAALTRLLGYYRDVAHAADTHLNLRLTANDRAMRFPDRGAALSWLDAERANLVAVVTVAHQTGHDEHARDITLSLFFYFDLRKHWSDWIATNRLALTSARRLRDRYGEAACLGNLGIACREVRRFGEALDHYQQALTIRREIGDRHGEGMNLASLGIAYRDLGKADQAIDCYQRALTVFRQVGDTYAEGRTLNNLGVAYNDLGQLSDAIFAYRRALAVCRAGGDRYAEGRILADLGTTYRDLRRFDQALDHYEKSLAIRRELGDRYGESRALYDLGVTYRGLGQLDTAADCHRRSLAACREIGDRYTEGHVLTDLGIVYGELSRFDDAADCYQRALVLLRPLNEPDKVQQIQAATAELTVKWAKDPSTARTDDPGQRDQQ
ncbi:tetratricopeptide repeat protein [Amycolatopsis sp. NPDC049688]|uniref:tetratricopeptide repeat protein n=1 Tax=Amycolatopsis sp. NPDC049688 TaxID=3154733 RepID=UPI00344A7A92